MGAKSEIAGPHDLAEGRDVAIECLKAARSEISERIRLREQTLAAYFVGVISIVGFVVSKDVAWSTGLHAPDLLLFVPAIAFAAGKVIADNHDVVSALAMYQAIELGESLSSSPSLRPVLWERSLFLLKPEYMPNSGSRRLASAASGKLMRLIDPVGAADIVTIVGPAVGALVLYAITSHGYEVLLKGTAGRIAFCADWLLLVWSGILIYRSSGRRARRRHYILQLFHPDE